MASNDRVSDAAPTVGNVVTRQPLDQIAQVAIAMHRMAEMQQMLAESAAESAAACIEAVVLAQKDIRAMTADAASAQDPIALLSLPHRAFQASLRHGLACATRNVLAAQSLKSWAFGRTEDPDPGRADDSRSVATSAFATPPSQNVKQRNPS